MSIRFLIIVLALMSSSLKAQVIDWVNYAHQSDVKVYVAQHRYEVRVNQKYLNLISNQN